MKCPKCGATLMETTYKNQKIYICNQCGGAWVDGNEVLKIVGEGFEFPESKEKGEIFYCPRCEIKSLHSFKYPNSDRILEICEKCHGIWFDPGELQIIQSIHKKGVEKGKTTSEKIASKINQLISSLLK